MDELDELEQKLRDMESLTHRIYFQTHKREDVGSVTLLSEELLTHLKELLEILDTTREIERDTNVYE